MTKKFVIAYSQENEDIAREMEQSLSPAGFVFDHRSCSNTMKDISFNEELSQSDSPVLLLVSDNFLKSVAGMHQALATLQDLLQRDLLQVIVIDGRYKDSNSITHVPTVFDRIGQIIKYMNHWQEEYLQLRQSGGDSDSHENHLAITRSISTQIGEYLRHLRDQNYWEYKLLKEAKWEPLFHRFGYQSLYPEFSKKMELSTSKILADSSAPGEDVIIEIEEQSQDIPDIADIENLSEIPGIELLDVDEVSDTGSVVDDHPHPPAESSPELDLNGGDFIEEVKLAEEIVPSPPQEINSLEVEEDIILEEEVLIEFEQEIEEVIEEVTEEEGQIERNYKNEAKTPVSDSYSILESIFLEEDDGEEGVQEEEELEPHEIEQHQEGEFLPELESDEFDKEIDQLEEAEEAEGIEEERLEESRIEQLKMAAETALGRNDFTAAMNYYEEILEEDKSDELANLKLGQMNFALHGDQPKKAEKYFKKTLESNPENVEALYQYAVLLAEKLDKPNKAISHFEKAIEVQGDHPFANYDLALIHYSLEKFVKAKEYYEKAYAINPEIQTKENDEAFNLAAFQEAHELKEEQIHNSLYPELGMEEKINTENKGSGDSKKIALEEAKKQDKAEVKTVLITGATSGIGQATADIFARNGYRLILTGRRQDRLKNLNKHFKKEYHSQVKTLQYDVRNIKEVKRAMNSLKGKWSNVDILINNAGLAKGYGPIQEGDIEDWDTMIDTNVKGLLYMTRAISPQMVERRSGHIINVASTAGKEVYPNGNVYCASKFAVDALTKSMRLDLHKHNIRVSQVSPGHVEKTEFAEVRFDGDKERARIYDDFRPLTSKDVAEAIFFIATRPAHVNVQDVLMMGTQQASNNHIDRSGR